MIRILSFGFKFVMMKLESLVEGVIAMKFHKKYLIIFLLNLCGVQSSLASDQLQLTVDNHVNERFTAKQSSHAPLSPLEPLEINKSYLIDFVQRGGGRVLMVEFISYPEGLGPYLIISESENKDRTVVCSASSIRYRCTWIPEGLGAGKMLIDLR